MKQFITIGLSLLLCYTLNAQTLITHNHLTPTIGSTILKNSTQAQPINFQSNGQNVTWDLSSMTTSTNNSTTYIAVSDAQDPSMAPNASFVKDLNNGELFVTLNDSLYSNTYFNSYQNNNINYNFNLNFNLPMQYGNIDTSYIYDTLTATGSTVYRTFTSIHSVVGEGTLSTPEGTFANCLKSKIIRNFTDSSASTQQITTTIDTTYYWFSADYPDPLMSISINFNQGTQQTTYYTTFQEISSAANASVAFDHLSIYPQPSTGLLNISNIPINTEVKVMNSIGKLVEQSEIQKGQDQLNLGHLEKGIYFLHFSSNDKYYTHQIILD